MNIIAVVVVALLALFVIITAVKAIVTVDDGGAAVIERLTGHGPQASRQFRTVLGPGRHFVHPIADRVRARVDLGEQTVSFPPRPIRASDGVDVEAEFEVRFTVEDPRAFVYNVENPVLAIEEVVLTALRQEIGRTTAERAIASDGALHRTVWTVLHDTAPKWGVAAAELTLAVRPPTAPEAPSTAQEWY